MVQEGLAFQVDLLFPNKGEIKISKWIRLNDCSPLRLFREKNNSLHELDRLRIPNARMPQQRRI